MLWLCTETFFKKHKSIWHIYTELKHTVEGFYRTRTLPAFVVGLQSLSIVEPSAISWASLKWWRNDLQVWKSVTLRLICIKKKFATGKNILCQCYKRNAFQKRCWILIEIHVSKWSYEFNGKNDMIRFWFRYSVILIQDWAFNTWIRI